MAETPPTQPKRGRIMGRDGAPRVLTIGRRPAYLGDLYHFLLRSTWRRLLGLIVGWYLFSNLVFAALYFFIGGIENAREGSFSDAFFFSVQTMATIGYGKMVPLSLVANALVTLEAFYGLLSVALATSLLFSKFSKPTARVLFSQVAVVHVRDGVPSLMFRVANERGNQIVEATMRITVIRNERTAEGEPVRKVSDLRLTRAQFGVFALTWLAIHPIDKDSPLHGWTEKQLADAEAEIVASLSGTDETVGQSIYARYSYVVDEIVWNAKFADIMSKGADGRRAIDFRKFHDYSMIEPAVEVVKPRAQA